MTLKNKMKKFIDKNPVFTIFVVLWFLIGLVTGDSMWLGVGVGSVYGFYCNKK